MTMKTLFTTLLLAVASLAVPAESQARDRDHDRGDKWERWARYERLRQEQHRHHHADRDCYLDQHHPGAAPRFDRSGHRIDSHGHHVDRQGNHVGW